MKVNESLYPFPFKDTTIYVCIHNFHVQISTYVYMYFFL